MVYIIAQAKISTAFLTTLFYTTCEFSSELFTAQKEPNWMEPQIQQPRKNTQRRPTAGHLKAHSARLASSLVRARRIAVTTMRLPGVSLSAGFLRDNAPKMTPTTKYVR